jgi:hypothetical protein
VITSTMWTAPAGDLGLGIADVRADIATGVRLVPSTAQRPGTGLPAAARLRGPVAAVLGGVVPTTCPTSTEQKFHNGTTLGIHPSRRPSS